MITFIVRWDSVQMDALLEWRMWRQIKGAFFPNPSDCQFFFTPINSEMENVNIRQFETIEEAILAAPKSPRVFLEPTGQKTLSDIPDGDITILVGDTETSNAPLAEQDEMYRIQTPGGAVLYGTNAVAVALAVRHGQ